MRPSFRPPTRRRLAVAAVPAVGLALVATLVPASGEEPTGPDPASFSWSFQGEGDERVETADFREGVVAPTAAQEQAARAIGATTARWNEFGTPRVLLNHRGYLSAAAEGDADDVARAFVADHAGLFKLSAGAVDSLEVVTDSPLLEGPDLVQQQQGERVATDGVPHVVTFRQTFGDGPTGDLVAGNDGLLTVGVQRDGRVGYVTSSVTGDEEVSGSRTLDAVAALQRAADDAGLDLGRLTGVEADGPWTTFRSSLTRDLQRARLMAVPTPTGGTRLAWETTLLSSDHADDDHGPAAFISFVDAETGRVLLRDNRVDHLAEGLAAPAAAPSGEPFTGPPMPARAPPSGTVRTPSRTAPARSASSRPPRPTAPTTTSWSTSTATARRTPWPARTCWAAPRC